MFRLCTIEYIEGDIVCQNGLGMSPANIRQSYFDGTSCQVPEMPDGYFDDGKPTTTLDNSEMPLSAQPNIDMNDLYIAQEQAKQRIRDERASLKERKQLEKRLKDIRETLNTDD